MPATRHPARTTVRAAVGLGAVGAGCVAYAGLVERNAFRLRRFTVPALPGGAPDIRVLHISDLHMTPRAEARQRWVARLAGLEPDLVINTGDNLSHVDSVPFVLRSLGRLLDRPGVYVWGSNDYYGPGFKNPFAYLAHPSRPIRVPKRLLPWRDLDTAFTGAGWANLTHARHSIEINGVRIGFRGTDDAHLGADRYPLVAGPVDEDGVDVSLGVTHAPYRRVIDAMAEDGHHLIVAGHTHGGQVCLPFYGALVSNCDLDTRRVKGLSQHTAGGHTAWMHVSAGLGTSPYAPVRFACPPEATLLTLTSRSKQPAE